MAASMKLRGIRCPEVLDDEPKYGLSVLGLVHPQRRARRHREPLARAGNAALAAEAEADAPAQDLEALLLVGMDVCRLLAGDHLAHYWGEGDEPARPLHVSAMAPGPLVNCCLLFRLRPARKI